MIDGVKIKNLKVVPDERGRLTEILRRDDEVFSGFGQVYVTTTLPGVVKAWHKHLKQADNIACVAGMIKVALYDGREGSSTRGEVCRVLSRDPSSDPAPCSGRSPSRLDVRQRGGGRHRQRSDGALRLRQARRTAPRSPRKRHPLRLETQGRLNGPPRSRSGGRNAGDGK